MEVLYFLLDYRGVKLISMDKVGIQTIKFDFRPDKTGVYCSNVWY